MTQQTVLTPEQRRQIQESMQPWQSISEFGLAIEQAVLESPEVQALRKDAERYKELRAMATQQANTLGPIFRIDVQRTPKTMFNFDAAVDLAMEQSK